MPSSGCLCLCVCVCVCVFVCVCVCVPDNPVPALQGAEGGDAADRLDEVPPDGPDEQLVVAVVGAGPGRVGLGMACDFTKDNI